MQTRPRSEGGRVTLDAGAASAAVRRSYNSLDGSVSAGERGRHELGDRRSRRPRTTPRLLLGPSQVALYESSVRSGSPSGIDRSACFMTHLPDSPPKPKSTLSPRSAVAISRRAQAPERTSIGKSKLVELDSQQESSRESIVVSTAPVASQDDSSVESEAITAKASGELELGGQQAASLLGGQQAASLLAGGDSDAECEANDRESSTEEAEGDAEETDAGSAGPHHTDIDTVQAVEGEIAGPEEASTNDNVSPGSATSRLLDPTVDSDSDNDSDSEASSSSASSAADEYAATLVERQQVLDGASERIRLRSELEGYLSSLKTMRGEDGEALIEFPKNYNQILALMTEQDIRVENSSSSSTSRDTAKPPSAQQNWAIVLIQTGLAKQQAFGNLEDEDGDGGTASGLAAKIALKMAQIRQLDVVLEDKLGKNLYKAAPLRPSKKPERNQEPDRAPLSQPPGSVAKALGSSKAVGCSSRLGGAASSVDGGETSSSRRKDLHFIRRNKEVVANGMRANMTRAEEVRLRQLLEPDDESIDRSPSSAVDCGAASVDAAKPVDEANEFAMNAAEKTAIELLLASKPDLRRQSILAELEDMAMLDDIPEEEVSKRPENRKQRLRLHRIDQELRFLEETPSIAIVNDDAFAGSNMDDDTASEADSDCRSERSFRTVTSAGGSTTSSMCSTRSGVISRRQFRQFVAEQQAVYHSAPTASSDDIQRLLGSISRLNTPAVAPVS